MTGRDIIRFLVRNRWREKFVLPNYTPSDWFECDVFELTKADYMREYEVKISRADFFADAKKERLIRDTGRWEPMPEAEAKYPGHQRYVFDMERKHTLLASGDTRGPVHFWYVTPKGLIQQHELPVWAGLIEIEDRGGEESILWRLVEREVVPAPKLHKSKASDDVRHHALGVCYWRMHEALKGAA